MIQLKISNLSEKYYIKIFYSVILKFSTFEQNMHFNKKWLKLKGLYHDNITKLLAFHF